MDATPRILVVDDTPHNLKLLVDLLGAKGFAVHGVTSGAEALAHIAAACPDLVLLDVVMPGLSGYDVCRQLRADPATATLPVVMVTALDPAGERIKGLEAGADDFLGKPINQAELLARVRSLLRIKALHDTVREQAAQLAAWNAQLEQRVAAQVEQLGRLARLKRFLAPQLAELIVDGRGEDPLASHRREVTVVFLDLRGFTAFAETAEPEDVMAVLRGYHAAMGRLIQRHGGTLERFTGDGLMVFFNDPVVVPDATARAVRMALAMRDAADALGRDWQRRGIELGLAIGIAEGYATIGAIGFEDRIDYGAIGTVTNLAARLCGEAASGQILTNRRTLARVEALVACEEIGELALKGFSRPVAAVNLLALRPPAHDA